MISLGLLTSSMLLWLINDLRALISCSASWLSICPVDCLLSRFLQVITTFTMNEVATPGLKAILSFAVPDQRSGKVNHTLGSDLLSECLLLNVLICLYLWLQFELQYLHDYAGVNASIGLTANPIVNLSGSFGTKALAVGADISLDTASGNFTKYNAGLSVTHEDLIASLNLWVITIQSFSNPIYLNHCIQCLFKSTYCSLAGLSNTEISQNTKILVPMILIYLGAISQMKYFKRSNIYNFLHIFLAPRASKF